MRTTANIYIPDDEEIIVEDVHVVRDYENNTVSVVLSDGSFIIGAEAQLQCFAESILQGLNKLPKQSDNPYAGDKVKGDAFEALRRAEQ